MKKPKLLLKKRVGPAIKREWLELYYNKNASIRAIADDYGVSYSAVNTCIRRMTPEGKPRPKKKQTPELTLPDVDLLMQDGEAPETQLEVIISALMGAITNNKKVKYEEAITQIEKLTKSLKQLRSMQLESLLKTIDAKVVAALIRRIEPNASDLRVVAIFNEVLAEVRADR